MENRYRSLIPQVGQYTNVEPMHREIISGASGGQAYAYALFSPLSFSDPTGQAPGEKFPSHLHAACDAALEIWPKTASERVEYGALIYSGGGGFYRTSAVRGRERDVDVDSTMSECGGKERVVGDIHTHPPQLGDLGFSEHDINEYYKHIRIGYILVSDGSLLIFYGVETSRDNWSIEKPRTAGNELAVGWEETRKLCKKMLGKR